MDVIRARFEEMAGVTKLLIGPDGVPVSQSPFNLFPEKDKEIWFSSDC